MRHSRETTTFVVVDDDEIDREVIRRALLKTGNNSPVIEAEDGLEALKLLQGTEERPPLAKPYVVILDLNMPQMNGFQFLEVVRKDPELRYTPIFVLSTSDDTQDKLKAYQRCVSGYIVKSRSNQALVDAMDMLEQYQQVVEVPN